jgi:SAM-dependent methyltransferase
MRQITMTLSGALVVLLTGSLWWRRASRKRQLPCPYWLGWLLENPLTETVARTSVTLDRIGLRPGDYGLDVGSGPGRLTIPAARRVGLNGSIVAIDVQPQMLARLEERAAKAEVPNIVTKLGDITQDMGLPADHFDRAWLVTVLGEIPDRAAALRNLYRTLKPGGTLSVTEIVGDPHYQRRSMVLSLGRQAGFAPSQHWGSRLAFTQNLVKPPESAVI